ncbi:MAG: chromo domain-containing protein [Terriglobales bacterium]
MTEPLFDPQQQLPVTLQQFKQQLTHHLLHTSLEVAMYVLNHHAQPDEPPVQKALEPGQLVWLEDKTQTTKLHSRKLANVWTGPFLILEVLSHHLVLLLKPTSNIPRQTMKVSIDRLRPYLVPVFQPWMHGQHSFRFPLFILAKKIRNGQTYYKIQWLSKDPIPDSWELPDKLPLQLTFNYEQLLQRQLIKPRHPIPLTPTAADGVQDDVQH